MEKVVSIELDDAIELIELLSDEIDYPGETPYDVIDDYREMRTRLKKAVDLVDPTVVYCHDEE